jgi:methionine-rich copper-binding protein CopC
MRLLLILLLCCLSSPAFACGMLEYAVPKVGSAVSPAPREVLLIFSEPVVVKGSFIAVTDEQGKTVSTGPVYSDPKDETHVAVRLLPALPPGRYKVTSGILCHCGNITPGTYPFTVR